MNFWTSPDLLPPAIEVLVRRWALPAARVDDVKQLLAAQDEGGTAWVLPATSPTGPGDWGAACQVLAPAAPGDGTPRTATPLVLRHHAGLPHLQSWRYFQAEQTIAQRLLARAALPAPALARDSATLVTELGPNQVNAQQARAIGCALDHTLALITGGPGTGKTYTLARLLALLIAARPGSRVDIRLAAPTGKAAERMREAVDAAADQLPASLPAGVQEALRATARSAATLHKLLGFNPGTGQCRYTPETPLNCDVLIVDECSMVDTLQWQALLAALPPTARLILLGDPHQLESVAAGDVLGSLVRRARARPGSPLGRIWVELTDSHRFRERAGIGALATAVVNLRPDDAVALLAAHRLAAEDAPPADGLTWLGDHAGRFHWGRLPQSVQRAIVAVADAPTPEEALAALGRVRLLTAHRENLMGAAGLNDAIQRELLRRAAGERAPNQPIIINHNDPETGLTNGSVGVILESGGARAAYFPAAASDAPPRKVPLGQLPEHSPAWAMTIHRSQGSEFDQVVVILPAHESPLATRELIYTAVTRARQCVHVWGGEATVRAALGERALRCTLLEASL